MLSIFRIILNMCNFHKHQNGGMKFNMRNRNQNISDELKSNDQRTISSDVEYQTLKDEIMVLTQIYVTIILQCILFALQFLDLQLSPKIQY